MECSGDEQSRPISGQPDLMAPVLGVVSGTPGWVVRGIISISFHVHAAIENRLGLNNQANFNFFIARMA
jgi:hypothetical protein